MFQSALCLSNRGRLTRRDVFNTAPFVVLLAVLVAFISNHVFILAKADNFTDVFSQPGFRGSFNWIQKLDWVGGIVQAVISCFALIGTALIIIRIMTSLLYLSARGLWEEVHDNKETGESQFYDFGLVSMAKSWAKGKAGTGLDAIIGAILILLPDVKKYSDFGEKSHNDFGEDITMSGYVLKILLPTVLSIFFLAMAFNGTLMKGVATSVDLLGAFADKVVSQNYVGFAEDVANSLSYQFTTKGDSTARGKFMYGMQMDVFGKLVAQIENPSQQQLEALGKKVEEVITADKLAGDENHLSQFAEPVKSGIKNSASDSVLDASSDRFWNYIKYDIIINGSQGNDSHYSIAIDDIIPVGGDLASVNPDETTNKRYIHIYLEPKGTYSGTYFNAGATPS